MDVNPEIIFNMVIVKPLPWWFNW